MKRRFTRFIQWASKEHNGGKIAVTVVGIIAGIVLFLSFFVPIDKIPATEEDYEPLEKQMYAIQQNPDLLLKTDCKIDTTNGNIITVNISNDECGLNVEYDQDLKILSFSRYDKCAPWVQVLMLSLILSIAGTTAVIGLTAAVVMFIEEIYKNFKFAKSQKTIRVSKNDGAV